MTEVVAGLVSGVIWSAILALCLGAVVAVVAAMVSVRARVRSKAAGTTPALDVSPIAETERLRRDRAVASGAGVLHVRAGSGCANRRGEAPRAVASPPGGDLIPEVDITRTGDEEDVPRRLIRDSGVVVPVAPSRG
jgi:hypothetical protein